MGHLLRTHLRKTPDRQLIGRPLAVVANLCGICRSDDTSSSFALTRLITIHRLLRHETFMLQECSLYLIPFSAARFQAVTSKGAMGHLSTALECWIKVVLKGLAKSFTLGMQGYLSAEHPWSLRKAVVTTWWKLMAHMLYPSLLLIWSQSICSKKDLAMPSEYFFLVKVESNSLTGILKYNSV